jgi:hypothetical protein
MSEIRPDWNPSAPGLREAWDAGDHLSFYDEDAAAKRTSAVDATA